jgi:NTE family protein
MPTTTPNNKPTIGLALSGGGIRAVAHLGIMQALVDRGFSFSRIAATSAGSIAAVFYAAGYTPLQTLKIIQETHFLRMLRPAIGSTGLFSIQHAETWLQQYIPHNTFEGLNIPVTIAAVDLGHGILHYFNSGQLYDAVIASCCLPGIFKPVSINGRLYVDGGVLNNFPVEPLVYHCDFIIGSTCNHLPIVDTVDAFWQLVDRATMITVNATLATHKALCNVVIEPMGLGRYGIFDTKAAEEIYLIGYEEGLKTLQNNPALATIAQAF